LGDDTIRIGGVKPSGASKTPITIIIRQHTAMGKEIFTYPNPAGTGMHNRALLRLAAGLIP